MTDGIMQVYIGIDIDKDNTMLSFFHEGMKEPETVSTVIGSEHYRIKTALSKRKGMGQWYFGDDAIDKADAGIAVLVPDLYESAKENKRVTVDGEIFSARELFLIFIKKMLSLPGRLFINAPEKKITFTLDKVGMEEIELFQSIGASLFMEKEKVNLTDRRESFYYYALSQDESLYLRDVLLIDYDGTDMFSVLLSRNENTKPQVVNLVKTPLLAPRLDRDNEFLKLCEDLVQGKAISSVYLIGEGFDGDWMKESIAYLCKNRRVFMGKNLYSKGACYAGYIKEQKTDWPFVFIGDNELKMNLSLKVSDKNKMRFITLCTAGESWFDEKNECECILDGEPEVTVWIQKPDSREASMKVFTLTDIPERENRTTRIRINAIPESDRDIRIEIKDLGFGEIVPSSNKTWTYRLTC